MMFKKELPIIVLVGAILLALLWAIYQAGEANRPLDGQAIEKLADIPPQLRVRNWNAANGSGSCVFASLSTLLEWQGQHRLAEWVRETYEGGEFAFRIIKRMEAAGIKYAYTDSGDIGFLEAACRNRLAAAIFYKPSHAVVLVDINNRYARIVDVNYPNKYETIPRDIFEERWKEQYGGFGFTVVGTPPPPWPDWK